MNRLRPPAVAGSFYPEDPALLQKQVDEYLNKAAATQINGELQALIVPHAGYMYSGQIAAYAYRLLKDKKYSAVVVVGPSHYAAFYGASIYKGDGYILPTGEIPIYQELRERIAKSSASINYFPGAHIREHSVEVQLPFLHTVLPGFKLVPMVMGSQDMETCTQAAHAIATGIRGEKVLLVASSDLSHYHSYATAVEMDKIVCGYINNFDPEGLADAVAKGVCEACGAGPIITVMLAAKELGADSAMVIKYANSGDVSGSKGQVVGYLAAAIYSSAAGLKAVAEEKEAVGQASPEPAFAGLSAADKQLLHQIARTSIEAEVRGEDFPRMEITSPVLQEARGGFVTIKKQGHLRGCIGYIRAFKALHQTIREMAKSAALDDPRFSPVQPDELPSLELEISVLTPLVQIDNIAEISVGKHGLYIQKGMMSGLLLPQVATEYNWDRLTFLAQTCQKAGLPEAAWKDQDTKIFIFSADVF
ncbi:MAG: AmmeMemoRadiSam system protein B [Candidatus Schekmanbacteria bacterium]|nr:AmmeMemoRadiSam system protein B [Candidatus Schekmanbacteria bacterium]